MMSPIVLVAMLVTIPLIFLLPRKKVIVPLLLFIFLTPLGEQFTLGGLHFFAQRILILCGCIRMLFTSRPRLHNGFQTADKIFLAWAICRASAMILLYQDSGILANQLGFIWDVVGGYFLVRHLIQDKADIYRTAKVLAFIAVIIGLCMTYEKVTVTNLFARLMGGGSVYPNIRNGHVRARGVFNQEILASSFGGTLVPLFILLWKCGRSKIIALIGLAGATIITFTASSSTGISAYAIGVGVLFLWPVRRYMRSLRWSIVVAILLLAMVMNAPVWYLVARVDFAGGSTGWDRAYLVDQFVRHWSDWFLVGTNANSTWGDSTWDLCNQFVAEGEQGGILAFTLFIAFIARNYKSIGAARKRLDNVPGEEWFIWILGALLTSHLFAFFGISYFDQTKVWWFVTLAMLSAATLPSLDVRTTRATSTIPDSERQSSRRPALQGRKLAEV